MNNEKPFVRLGDVLYSVFDGKWIIIATTVIALLAGILTSTVGFVRGEMSKQYKIEASVLVSSQLKNGTFSTSSKNPLRDDISLAKELTDQAMYLMKSERTVSAAIDKLGMVGVSAKSIRNNLTLTQYNESQIIEISFLWRSKDEGVKILQTLEETTNEIMQNTMMIGKVVSVNDPKSTYIFGGQFNMSTWLIFAFGGAIAGAAFCIIRRLLHPTLLWSDDLEELFGLEVLERISYDAEFARSDPFMIAPERMDAEISSAAFILLDRLERSGINRFYVTSAGRQEGKTTLLADFAVKISQTGKRVLLVDCDFRNPALAPLFRVVLQYENTLNALYSGDSDVSDAVIRLSGNLHLLAYVLEEQPDTLSEPMLNLIETVAQDYDLVLIDAPAVGERAEALRLNAIADAALLIVKHDEADLSQIDDALSRLRKSEIPLIGAFVNQNKGLRDVLLEMKRPVRRFLRKRDYTPKRKQPRKTKKQKRVIYK